MHKLESIKSSENCGFVSLAYDGNGRYAQGLSAGGTSSFSWQPGELNISCNAWNKLVIQ